MLEPGCAGVMREAVMPFGNPCPDALAAVSRDVGDAIAGLAVGGASSALGKHHDMNLIGLRDGPCKHERALIPDNRVVLAIGEERGEIEIGYPVAAACRADRRMIGERVQPLGVERACERRGRVEGHLISMRDSLASR